MYVQCCSGPITSFKINTLYAENLRVYIEMTGELGDKANQIQYMSYTMNLLTILEVAYIACGATSSYM